MSAMSHRPLRLVRSNPGDAVTNAAVSHAMLRRISDGLEPETLRLYRPERIVAFDTRAAETYPRIVIRARRHGHPIAVADAQIASIAASRQFSLATRDVAPFQAAGVPTINPWTAQPEPESRGRRRTKPNRNGRHTK